MAKQPLEGIKVIDLTHAYNGPYCCMILADNGADVIKVEPPGGDQSRGWGPFDEETGESGYFTLVNRNKRGVELNLKNPKAVELLHKIIKDADVVVENYRPGVAKKLGVDYDTLKEINPKIIYASGSGFGQYGPLSHRPAYDIIAQSMGGIVNITGSPDAPPSKVGASIGDNVTGMNLAIGILLALFHRERTGEGQQVDVAMIDTIFSLLENFVPMAYAENKSPQRMGNVDPAIAPFDIYESKDGWIAVGAGNNRLFENLAKAMDREDILEIERYSTNDLRCQNYVGDLQNVVQEWCIDKTKAEIEEIMDEAGIPCGPVLEILEIAEHPHIKARDMIVELEHPNRGVEKIVGNPIKLTKTQGTIDFHAPLLGQDNKDVFGLTDEEYEKYKAEGVFD